MQVRKNSGSRIIVLPVFHQTARDFHRPDMWSNPIRLKDYVDAPDEPGVYEIGFFRSETFNPMYLGMSEVSIRDRLSAHYNGEGNEEVDNYLTEAERDNLYCRWSKVKDPRCKEADLLRSGKYEWNKRIEPQC